MQGDKIFNLFSSLKHTGFINPDKTLTGYKLVQHTKYGIDVFEDFFGDTVLVSGNVCVRL